MPELKVAIPSVVPAAQPSPVGETASAGDPAADAPGVDFAAVLAERCADGDVPTAKADAVLTAADDRDAPADPAASAVPDALASQLGVLALPPLVPTPAEAHGRVSATAMEPARDASPIAAAAGRLANADAVEVPGNSASPVPPTLREKAPIEVAEEKGASLAEAGAADQTGTGTHARAGIHDARPSATPQALQPASVTAVQSAAQPVPASVFDVSEPVAAPAWRDAVAERVTVMVREKITAAELHVHPPELGPVSVRIDVQGSAAAVVFAAQHPDTRNALTNALPQLAEALAAGGLQLADAQVGQGFASREGNGGGGSSPFGAARAESAESIPAAGRATRIGVGLVDVFA